MDDHAGRLVPADHRIRIGHAPRQRRLPAPVAVARELAAEAADRLADGDRGRGDVGAAQPRYAGAPEEDGHRDRAAREPAVEDEPAAVPQELRGRAYEVGPGVEHEPEARADDAPRGRPDHRRGAERRVMTLARELTRGHRTRREKGEREKDAEDVDRDGPQVEHVRDHRKR